MSVKISFVLPCYNVDRYIADCLDSIFAQEMPESEYEVICVNDCSTDNTRSVIVEYQKEHTNLFLIDHTTNLTSGGARNTGIEVSQGEYIWFVDPDDMIMQGSCDRLLHYVEKEQPDIVMFNNQIVSEEGNFVKNQIVFSNIVCCQGQDYIESYFPSRMSNLCIVWRCLFRRYFLIDNNLRYPLIRKSQDTAFLWKCLLLGNKVASLEDVFYSYRSNPYSVAKMSNKADVIFSEYILLSNEIQSMIENRNIHISAEISEDMRHTIRWHVNHIQALYQMPKQELLSYYGLIKKNRNIIHLLSPYMSKMVRFLYGGPLWRPSHLMVKMRLLQIMNKLHLIHIR